MEVGEAERSVLSAIRAFKIHESRKNRLNVLCLTRLIVSCMKIYLSAFNECNPAAATPYVCDKPPGILDRSLNSIFIRNCQLPLPGN